MEPLGVEPKMPGKSAIEEEWEKWGCQQQFWDVGKKNGKSFQKLAWSPMLKALQKFLEMKIISSI